MFAKINISGKSTACFHRSPIALAVSIALCLSGGPVFAQTSAAAAASDSTVNLQSVGDPHNGFAENLKPSRARSGSKTVVLNTPYAPIRKVDDEGQVAEIEMFVGESRIFPAPGVSRIAVGNGQAMTAAAIDGKEVILFANQVGTSSLFLWNADGRYQRVKISIVPGDTTRHAREIAAFLSSIPKAKASIVGANVIVEGDELSDSDLAKIDDLTKRYPQIVNFTNRVGWEQMVLLDIKVVEFPVSLLRNVGLNWTGTGGAAVGGIWSPFRRGDGSFALPIQTGQTSGVPVSVPDAALAVPPGKLNILSALNLGLNAQLELLEQEGKAVSLASPQLSARSGSKASFLAGGEIPYAVQSIDGPRVLFKTYGVKLDITPKVDHNGIIRSTIIAEVSSVDRSVVALGGPALLTRRVETEFNLRNGETIVLAGLLQRDNSTDIDKVPFLGDIPVLGALFRSKHYQNKETELVVFVTPTVVDARSARNADRIQRTTERLTERLGPQPFLTNPLQPDPDPTHERTLEDRHTTASPDNGRSASQAMPPAAITPMLADTPLQAIQSPKPAAGLADMEGRPPMPRPGGALLTVTVTSTVLRTSPGLNSTFLMQLDRGAVVQMGRAELKETASGPWRQVVVGSVAGWLPAGAVRPVRLQSAEPVATRSAEAAAQGLDARRPATADSSQRKALTPATTSSSVRYQIGVEGLALRLTPDMNGEVVARLPLGRTVVALDQPPRGGWTAIQNGRDGPRGWVATQWLVPAAP